MAKAHLYLVSKYESYSSEEGVEGIQPLALFNTKRHAQRFMKLLTPVSKKITIDTYTEDDVRDKEFSGLITALLYSGED